MIDHNHISSALQIINPGTNKYSENAFEIWVDYEQKKIPNVYFNKAKAMLNEGQYRAKSDAIAYLSGIIMMHKDYIV